MQETWIAVLRGLDGFEARSSLRTWISRILIRTAGRRAALEGRSLPFSAVAGEFEGALGEQAGRQAARSRIEELRARAGREFDPMVVEALVLVGVEEGWLDRGWALGPSDAADAA